MASFFLAQLDYIFFFYGLSFILLGIICSALYRKQVAQLPWIWLALFGFSHGIHEWLDMLAISLGDSKQFIIIRLILMLVSFVFLTEFGRVSMRRLLKKGPGRWIFLPLLIFALLGGIVDLTGLNVTSRYAFGFVGAFWSAVALYLCSKQNKSNRWSLTTSSIGFALFAIATGIIVPQSSFFPASVINQSWFFSTLGIPIQLIRGILALIITISFWHYELQANLQFNLVLASKRKVRYSYFLVIILILILSGGWIATEYTGNRIDKEDRENILLQTKLAAAAINPTHAKNMTGTLADENHPDYLRLREQLSSIKNANPSLRWLYIMLLKDHRVVFTVDSIPINEFGHAPPGEVYDDAPPELNRIFVSGQSETVGPYTDKWGTWISGFAPIRKPKSNQILGVLGVDIEATHLLYHIAHQRLMLIVVCLLLSLFVTGLFMYRIRLLESTAATLVNEQNLTQAQEIAHLGNWTYAPATNEVTWSEEIFHIFGRDQQDGVPRFQEHEPYIHPEDWMHLTNTINQSIQFGTDYEISLRIIRPDGTMRYTIAKAQTKQNQQKKVVQLFGTIQDITDQKQAELVLQNNFQFLQVLLDAIPSPVFYKNSSGLYLGCNDAYAHILGLTKDQIIGKTVHGVMPENLADFYHQKDSELLQHPGTQQFEASLVDVNHNPHEVIFNQATYQNADDKVAGIIGAILDITAQKNTENTLRKTEQILRAIIDSAPVAIFSLDKVGKVIMWNAAAERIFGWRKAEIIGQLLPIVPEEKENEFYTLFTRVLNGNILTNIELQRQKKDKTLVYVTLSAAPLFDSANRIIGIMAIMADITERKQAEEAIHEAQQQYEGLVNNLPIGIYRNTPGPEGRFLAANPAIVEMFEADSLETFLTRPVSDQYADPDKHKTFSEKIMQHGYVKDEELELISFKGRKFWASVTAIMKKDKNEIYFDGTIRDITDRKLAVQQLIESEERFRIISSSAQDAIVMMDTVGNVSYWNPAAETIFGYKKDEIIGKNLHATLAPSSYHSAHQSAFSQWQKTGTGNAVGKTLELTALRKDGAEITIELSLSSVKVFDKWQSIGIIRDITDRKKTEEQLRTLSLTDELTGLYNRRGFITLAEQQIKIADRLKQELCLFYIDLDQMKWINDTLGHKEGDRALTDTANILRTTFRAADIIGRIGGDEFVGLAIESKETTDNQIFIRLQEHLNALNIFGKRAYQLSLSIGITRYNPNHPDSIDTLLEQGDKLMYEQKKEKKRNHLIR